MGRRRGSSQILGKPAVVRRRGGAQVLSKPTVGGRWGGAQVLGESTVGRRLGRQADLTRQGIHQHIHIIRFPAAIDALFFFRQAHHLRIGIRVPARYLGCRYRPGVGIGVPACLAGCSLCRLRRLGLLDRLLGHSRSLHRVPGAHGVIGVHKILGAVQRGGIQCPQLHGKTCGGAVALRHGNGFPHRFPRAEFRLSRRRGMDLLARGKFNGIALFAVDRSGVAGRSRSLPYSLFDLAQHLHGVAALRLRGGRGAGIFAVPYVLNRVGLGFLPVIPPRLCRRLRFRPGGGLLLLPGNRLCRLRDLLLFRPGGGFLLPGFGNHDFLTERVPAEQTAPEPLLFRGLGRFFRLPVREIFFLLQFRCSRLGQLGGRFLRGIAGQRHMNRHELVGIVGGFQAEQPPLFLAGFPDFSFFIGYHRHRIPEKFLELIFSLVQGIGVGFAVFSGHLEQKALDDTGTGGIPQCAGIDGLFRRGRFRGHRLHRGRRAGRHGLHGGRRLTNRRGCRCGRARRRRAARLNRGGRCFPVIPVPQAGKRDGTALGRSHRRRRGGNAHAAQDFVHLMVRHGIPHTGRRLLLIQILQDAVYRIVGTFAWHV